MSDSSQGAGWWLASDGKWYPPQSAQQWTYRPPRRTNPFAVASLVCGLVWIGGLASLLAVGFGVVALVQIPRGDEGGKGIALAGVLLGGLGIAVMVLLMAFGDFSSRRGYASTATVDVDAAGDACWFVTLGDPDSRIGSVRHEGCGDATYEIAGRLEWRVLLTKRTGPGPVTAVLRGGGDTDQAVVTQNLQTARADL